MLFEITKRFLEIGVQFLFADAADDAAARAIAAITRATIGHEKQNAIRITMHQSRHRHVRIFTARIGHVVRRRPGLFDPRDDLAPDRIVRILIARDQVEKMRRDGEREFVAGKQHPAAFLVAQVEIFLELGERGDPILELPFPIVPKFRRDPAIAGPIAGRVRDELFPVQFLLIAEVTILVEDENAKTIRNRVNEGTWRCAMHLAVAGSSPTSR